MDQDETRHAGRPRPWPHCVRWGPSSPSAKKGAEPPNFRPMSVVAKQLDGSRCHLVWRMQIGLGPGHIVRDGDLAPPPQKKGAQPSVA